MQNLPDSPATWSFSQKLIFRLMFLYFAIYIFFTPNNDLPVINKVYESINDLLHRFIPWFAKTFLGYKKDITVFTNGSGDTTYDYMLWFFVIVVAIAGTMLWTLLDRRRKSYDTLYYWIRVLVRYYLFYTMISYGLFKVIKLQFPFPYLSRLVQPYGESSPMGLVWTYMGYSDIYNYFTGFAELLAGVLLLFRRTTTLGALVCFAVMTNVFMMNMGYDIPVKLLSFNTILMSLFLLWKDLRRLVYFFIVNKQAAAANINLPYSGKKWRYFFTTLKILFIVFIVWINLDLAITSQKEYGEKAPKAPLYGIYYTETIVKNNDTLKPLATDSTAWKRLIVQREGYAIIKMMNDSTRGYNFRVDTTAKAITMFSIQDTANKTKMNYVFENGYLSFNGRKGEDSVQIRMKRFDENNFRLVNRGFHWVNEFPFNR